MSDYSKVLWGEGLFLRPQHFQRQDAYHEHRLTRMLQASHPYFWGIQSVKIDPLALSNSVVKVIEVAAIFPDGELYLAPGQDEPPLPLNLSNSETPGPLTIMLAIPLVKDTGHNFRRQSAHDEEAETRYVSENLPTIDLFTEAVTADVSYLKKNVRLVTEFDPQQHLAVIPVMRVRRAATGGFELDPLFITPSVAINASPCLTEMLSQVLDILEAKIEALYGYHREPSRHIIEFRSGDVASFWLLHTASTACAVLRHLQQHPELHPEQLYSELLRLAGALMTFSKKHKVTDLPTYDHANPNDAFRKLDSIVRDLLEAVISTKFFSIVLREETPSFHNGRLDSGKIEESTNFYLSVQSTLTAAQLMHLVPQRFKVGALEDVNKLVLSAMPGIPLEYTPQVPSAIPVRPNQCYFVLKPGSGVGRDLYERMLKSQGITIYAPPGITDLKLELIAVNR